MQQSSLETQRGELEKVRQERQQVLARLNDDVKARDQKLAAREQDQADLSKVLKTIEETLARQAREAEEARQKALIAQQEAEKSVYVRPRRWQMPTTMPHANRLNRHPAHWFPVPAKPLAAHLLQLAANFHGLSMVDCWRASVKAVATTPGPSGTA